MKTVIKTKAIALAVETIGADIRLTVSKGPFVFSEYMSGAEVAALVMALQAALDEDVPS